MRLSEIPHGDLYIGMEVQVVQTDDYYRLNTTRRYRIQTQEVFRVTSIFAESVNVRSLERKENRWTGRNEEMSFSFMLHQLQLSDPNRPAPRKLGRKPEGDEFIGVDHPGIQWLFEDMGKFADQQGYCPQYDALTAKLGIPGRPRDFTVNKTVNGVQFHTTVKARSQREANELVEKALQGTPSDSTVAASEPDYAPAA
jgi:organic hydroperoxide reductase OsmC/OhrA